MIKDSPLQASVKAGCSLVPACPETMSEVHALSQAELAKAHEIQSLIEDSATEGAPEEVYRFFTRARIRLLAAICSRQVFSGIRRFCMKDSVLQEAWKKSLALYRYPDFPVPTVNGKHTVHLFTMVLGYYYYRRYKRWLEYPGQNARAAYHAGTFLVYAIKLKIPGAMRNHLKSSIRALSELCHTVEEGDGHTLRISAFTDVVAHLLETAESLGNHLWSPGYFTAGVRLREAAIQFAGNPGQILSLERIEKVGYLPSSRRDYPLSLQLMAAAIRSYYFAWLLLDMDYSRRLWPYLSPDGDELSEDPEFWDELKRSILHQLKYTFRLYVPEILVQREMDDVMELYQLMLAREADEEKQESLSNRLSPGL